MMLDDEAIATFATDVVSPVWATVVEVNQGLMQI